VASKGGRHRSAAITVLGTLLICGACGSTGHGAASTTRATVTTGAPTSTVPTSTAPPSTASPSTVATASTTTTLPVVAVSGVETVLSPIGLNVRARPSKSAPVLGSAGEGTVLHLLGRTAQHGGWYKVRGETVTGWITSDPTYSARGRFGAYGSAAFSVLYPAGWTSKGVPHTGVTFRPPSGTEKVVIASAPRKALLPTVKEGGGVSQSSSKQVVACGVTAYLVSYTTAIPGHYLADLVLPVATHHYLGVDASLTSVAQLSTVLVFVNSMSFPFPECVGRPPSPTPTTRAKARHPSRPSTT
jgi:hypothetical protein